MVQALSIAVSACLLFFLEQIDASVIETNIYATWQSSVLFCLLLLSAMVGSLAAMVMDVSIERVSTGIITIYMYASPTSLSLSVAEMGTYGNSD